MGWESLLFARCRRALNQKHCKYIFLCFARANFIALRRPSRGNRTPTAAASLLSAVMHAAGVTPHVSALKGVVRRVYLAGARILKLAFLSLMELSENFYVIFEKHFFKNYIFVKILKFKSKKIATFLCGKHREYISINIDGHKNHRCSPNGTLSRQAGHTRFDSRCPLPCSRNNLFGTFLFSQS